MRLATLSLFIVSISLLFHRTAASQIPAKTKTDVRKQSSAIFPFPCYAKKENMPRTFNGFWSPKPANKPENQVDVTIGFHEPDSQFPIDCVGEPLEITVPNDQIVNLWPQNWDPLNPCTPTISIAPAVADSSIAELLTLVAKFGALGYDGGSNYLTLPKLRNKVLTVTVVCKPGGHILTQSVKITYQSPPRVAVSAGLVVSSLGVKSYGIKPTKTGVGSNGVATTQQSIAVTGSSSAQVVPFGFANLYLAGSRKLNISAQFGVGINPNLSSPRIEFFATPVTFAWHDFYFAPGIHIGQYEKLTGGFATGDITSGLSKAPTNWGYHGGFGFSLSYNLKPLVKSAAPSK